VDSFYESTTTNPQKLWIRLHLISHKSQHKFNDYQSNLKIRIINKKYIPLQFDPCLCAIVKGGGGEGCSETQFLGETSVTFMNIIITVL